MGSPAGEADREIFRQQLQKRKRWHNDDYELTFCRFDNKRRIAVRIYDEREAAFINGLPIDGVDQMALHYLAVDEEHFIKRLSRDVWTCDTTRCGGDSERRFHDDESTSCEARTDDSPPAAT